MNAARSSRSTFVSVIAWIFIVLSGFGTLASIAQNVMIAYLFPMKEMQQAMHDPHGPPVPSIAQFMLSHMQLLAAAVLVLIATLFISSVGLLRRKNWARRLFILFMALGIVWHIAGLAFQFFFFVTPQTMEMPPNAPRDFASGFHTAMVVIEAASILMAVAFTVLFGWIIKRLVSEEAKEEFRVYSYE